MAIENISQFATKLPEMSSQISSLSEKIEIIINNINNGEGTLAKLITDDSIYNNANTLLANTNNLIIREQGSLKGKIVANNIRFLFTAVFISFFYVYFFS